MLILPAIDLQQGVCVRLLRGDFDAATEYGDPFAQIRSFAEAGARWVHIVDLDGAKTGAPAQHQLIGELAAHTKANIQSGGGVRARAHVEALLEAGVSRVVVGSLAAREPELVLDWLCAFGSERLCIALDVRPAADGWEVAMDGWRAGAGIELMQLLAQYPPRALRHVLVTDISRDGALVGPNVDLICALARARPDLELQASGGVAQLDDLRAVRAAGAAGVIIGRALYERRFTLEDALAL